jgi:hypothetical protein
MKEKDPLEESIIESLGRQPIHIRMIHRIVNDKSNSRIQKSDIRVRLDRLSNQGIVERDGEYYAKIANEE